MSETPTVSDSKSDGNAEHACVDAAERLDPVLFGLSRLLLTPDATPKCHGREQRDHRESQQQRTGQGGAHGDGHGAKHASFQALQEQDRQVDRDDDDDGERHGPRYFVSGVAHRFKRRLAAMLLFEAMHGVLHHDDSAVDNHSEIDGAQAHQVGADAEQSHAEEADQHGERNDRGCDQGRAQVAKEQQQNDGH